ncbi:MAG: UDP-N-acetylmuramoyl-tripeptide--D-alanyl-D-alanine ligase [Desulfomicrobium escambiense]|nr:UDP-N-acetylmuramoyl-tripeptide--D-alanyl-D-alanine ligase [Desulfomicrobium escambiense]
MAVFSLDDIARTTGGTVLQGSPALAFDRFGIDSRLAAAGELFFAVPGKRDGHDFVLAAAAAGAAGAVVARPVPDAPPGFGLVLVSDTVAALQALAREVLRRRPVKVVGITGSVGKTTTKDFTAALLAPRFRVLKSEGNFNNHLGLALSLLRLGPDHDAAVLEMGMSAPGEIRFLTRIAPPDVAVVTNVSPVHLQFFRSLDGIALAKKEILDGAGPGATAVLNADDPLVVRIAAGFAGRKVTFGRNPGADVRAEAVDAEGLRRLRDRSSLRRGTGPHPVPLRQRGRRGEPPGRRGRRPRPGPPPRRDRSRPPNRSGRPPGAACSSKHRAASASTTIPTTRIPGPSKRPCTAWPPCRPGARSPCWPTCWSSGRANGSSTARRAKPSPAAAGTSSSPSALSPPSSPRAPSRRASIRPPSIASPAPGPRPRPSRTSSGTATSSWSKARGA